MPHKRRWGHMIKWRKQNPCRLCGNRKSTYSLCIGDKDELGTSIKPKVYFLEGEEVHVHLCALCASRIAFDPVPEVQHAISLWLVDDAYNASKAKLALDSWRAWWSKKEKPTIALAMQALGLSLKYFLEEGKK